MRLVINKKPKVTTTDGQKKFMEEFESSYRRMNPLEEGKLGNFIGKMIFKSGGELVKGKLYDKGGKKIIDYHISDFEEPISKQMLLHMKKKLGADFTLITTAGIELHSKELKGNKWRGITIQKQIRNK